MFRPFESREKEKQGILPMGLKMFFFFSRKETPRGWAVFSHCFSFAFFLNLFSEGLDRTCTVKDGYTSTRVST